MKLLLVVCMGLMVLPASAADKLIIVAERSTVMGVEQTGIVVEGNSVKFNSNSNFLFQNYPYPIGLFETKVTDQISKWTRDLTKPESIKEKSIQSPHGLKVYVNGKLVSHESRKIAKIRNLIQTVSKAPNLKVKGGVILKSDSDLKNIKCTKTTENVCEFKFGYLHK